MMEEFETHHQKITPYHPQENETIEALKKILDNSLNNIFNVKMDE
jgi:hypothetical protein